MKSKKVLARLRRGIRVRAKVSGTAQRPRLVVFRSLKSLEGQLIDDDKGLTLVGITSRKKTSGGNILAAAETGKEIAEKMKKAGVSECVFDRNGYKYHGRVKAFADAVRENGIKF